MNLRGSVFLGGLLLGIAVPVLLAARNSGGTHSLPAGNPVVSGTTITPTWANNTLGDISTELTNSLDRNGRGAMLAPLQLSDGTSSAPGLTFGSDTNTGLYRAGAADVRLQIDANNVCKWEATGVTIPVGLVVTELDSNGAGVTATGNGTGAGLVGTGGSTSGAGATLTGGAPNGRGATLVADGTGVGLHVTGGDSSGEAITATGGAPNGRGATVTGTGTGNGIHGTGAIGGVFTGTATVGVSGTGAAGQAGASFANGTAATGGTRQNALVLTNGDIDMSGVADSSTATAVSNKLTPTNIPKAWGRITTDGAGGCTVNNGFNLTSCTAGANTVTITMASAMTNTNYAHTWTCEMNGGFAVVIGEENSVRTTTAFQVRLYRLQAGGTLINNTTTAATCGLVVFGEQ